jgi:hypothetical protein
LFEGKPQNGFRSGFQQLPNRWGEIDVPTNAQNSFSLC